MLTNWLRPDIIEIEYDSISTMMNAVYRFSHYHEYPEWREKLTTKEALDKYYEKEHGNKNWWKNKWAGANLRDIDIKPFIEGKFGELDESEQAIVDLVKDKEKYGIAIYAKQTKVVREHELAHALFYLDQKYRDKCSIIVKSHWDKLTPFIEKLSVMYDDENLVDELHVYAGTFHELFARPQGLIAPRNARRELCRLFNKHIKKG